MESHAVPPVDEEGLRALDLVRADVSLRVRRDRLQLLTAHDLFSGDAVDSGSTLLLRSVRRTVEDAPATVTDLGSGLGPLGLWAKSTWPSATTRLLDRDALAVTFSRTNAARNGLDVSVDATLLLDGAPGDQDLVLTNVPGKAGPGALRHLVRQGLAHLSPAGRLALVAVQPIADVVTEALEEVEAVVVDRHDNATYTVIVATNGPEVPERIDDSFSAGAYDRDRLTMEIDGSDEPIDLRTVHGLAEFDNPSFGTLMAWQVMRSVPDSLLVVNPGQGIIAAGATRSGAQVALMSRDLLQLRAAERAVADAGGRVTESRHVVPGLDPSPPAADATIVMCGRRDRAAEVTALVANLAESTERVVLVGRNRLIADAGKSIRSARTWWVGKELSHEGTTAVELTPRPDRP